MHTSQNMVRQEEAETREEDAAEEEEPAAAAGEEMSCRVLAIGDCEVRSLLNNRIYSEHSQYIQCLTEFKEGLCTASQEINLFEICLLAHGGKSKIIFAYFAYFLKDVLQIWLFFKDNNKKKCIFLFSFFFFFFFFLPCSAWRTSSRGRTSQINKIPRVHLENNFN